MSYTNLDTLPSAPSFKEMHGDWQPQYYHIREGDIPSIDVQIGDLNNILGETGRVYRLDISDTELDNNRGSKIRPIRIGVDLERHCETLQFCIEMNCVHTPIGYEHNVYLKGVKYPVYTETVKYAEGHILGNFWGSFVEYGLPHVSKV